MSESIVTNEDCRAVMARYPDRHFFTIADPPYGLSITDSHRERERDAGSSADYQPRSAEERQRPLAQLVGKARSRLANVNFTMCSTTAPRRTPRHSGSYRG